MRVFLLEIEAFQPLDPMVIHFLGKDVINNEYTRSKVNMCVCSLEGVYFGSSSSIVMRGVGGLSKIA